MSQQRTSNPKYTHSVRLLYEQAHHTVHNLFDSRPEETPPESEHGPTMLDGLFQGQPARIELCTDNMAYVWGQSEVGARTLARDLEARSRELAAR